MSKLIRMLETLGESAHLQSNEERERIVSAIHEEASNNDHPNNVIIIAALDNENDFVLNEDNKIVETRCMIIIPADDKDGKEKDDNDNDNESGENKLTAA